MEISAYLLQHLPTLLDFLPELGSTTHTILLQLAAHADPTGQVTAAQSDVTSWTGIQSPNTVKKGIRELIERGMVKVLHPSRERAPAIYQLCISGKSAGVSSEVSETTPALTTDNQLRLAAIKKSLSPMTWDEIKRESGFAGQSVDLILIRKYFGPGRIDG